MGGVLQEIIGNDGARGFMRGCSAIAAGTVPAHVALFTTYELAKKRLLEGRDHDAVRAAMCGAASQFSHDLILTPADVVKQRMQLGCGATSFEAARSILRREGAAALFRSLPTTLAMNLPFGSILVAANESFKHSMGLEESSDERSVLPWYFVSAGVSGGIAAAATQPLDVIKTRLQTQDCLARSVTSPAACSNLMPKPKYNGFLMASQVILREEGPRAFFHGLAPRVLYTMPAAAICWGTYDSIKSVILRERSD
jgi:solute carrier family 25 iron transporter 28/37